LAGVNWKLGYSARIHPEKHGQSALHLQIELLPPGYWAITRCSTQGRETGSNCSFSDGTTGASTKILYDSDNTNDINNVFLWNMTVFVHNISLVNIDHNDTAK
jgi:hypothetical protein